MRFAHVCSMSVLRRFLLHSIQKPEWLSFPTFWCWVLQDCSFASSSLITGVAGNPLWRPRAGWFSAELPTKPLWSVWSFCVSSFAPVGGLLSVPCKPSSATSSATTKSFAGDTGVALDEVDDRRLNEVNSTSSFSKLSSFLRLTPRGGGGRPRAFDLWSLCSKIWRLIVDGLASLTLLKGDEPIAIGNQYQIAVRFQRATESWSKASHWSQG